MIHDDIEQILKRWVVFRSAAPGASAAVAAFRSGRWLSACGAAGARSSSDQSKVTPDTLYDLASLTKPVLACTLARLVRQGTLRWDTSLGQILPAARGTPSEDAPLLLLLAHRAGLEAHFRVRERGASPLDWLRACAAARRPECTGALPPQGFAPVYSDLGYILLGAALEVLLARPLERLFADEVFAPLGLELGSASQWSARLGADVFAARVAPTELLPERGGELVGAVHDDNAWDLAGLRSAGHAGLFGTARGVLAFGEGVLDALAGRRSNWLTPNEVHHLVAERPGGSLRAGFDGKASQASSAGAEFGEDAFGHLGFTGTSLWCDPRADIVVVLLTNRVNPSRDNIIIRSVRPGVHGELFGLAADLQSPGYGS